MTNNILVSQKEWRKKDNLNLTFYLETFPLQMIPIYYIPQIAFPVFSRRIIFNAQNSCHILKHRERFLLF